MNEIETLRKLVEAGDKCSEFVLEDDCVFDNEDYAFAKLAINSRPILKALLERVERYEDAVDLLKDYADTNRNVTDENPFVRKVRTLLKALEDKND